MSSFFDEIAAKLATLSGSATPKDSLEQLNEFDVRDIQAVRVSEGGGGGGGNVPFVGVDPPASPTDGMLWWDPDDDTPSSAGFQIVSAFLAVDSGQIDVAAGSPVYIVFDKCYDNCVDMNEQIGLPDGIGLSGFGTDTLTTTEAGVWAFSMGDLAFVHDATWTGDVNFGNLGGGGGPSFFSFPTAIAVNTRELSLSQTLALPSGAGFSIGIATFDAPTANPYNVQTPSLSIVRLA